MSTTSDGAQTHGGEMADLFDDLNDWDNIRHNHRQVHLDMNNPPIPPISRREMRRQRKLRKRRFVVRIILVVVVVMAVCISALFGYQAISRTFSRGSGATIGLQDYTGEGTGSVRFIVQDGQGAGEIAHNLVKAHVIKSAEPFINTVSLQNTVLYPGLYLLRHHMSAKAALKVLSNPKNAGGILEIKTGERTGKIIRKLAKRSKIPLADIQAVINSGGVGILPPEAQGHFEGWLQPGSYVVASTNSARDFLKMIVNKRIAQLDSLGVPKGIERQRILKIASIAEMEVNTSEYYKKVARVILNRLSKGMPLGMDSTVAYGANISSSKLTDALLNDPSNPYNSRVHKGLPPTPICNPGAQAISAALNPTQGNWLYFVTTNLQTGETKFVNTEDEFEQIRLEYKNSNPNAN